MKNHSYFSGYGFYRLYCDQNVPAERAGSGSKRRDKKGAFLKLKGVTTIDRFDSELTIGSVAGIKKLQTLPVQEWIPALRKGWSFTAIQNERYGRRY